MIEQPNSTRSRFPGLALVAIAIGLGGLAVKVFDGERDLASSFEMALDGRGTDLVPGTRSVAAVPPVVGNEAFWLDGGRPSEVSRASYSTGGARIGPGDRFELLGEAGKRILEVIDVRSLETTASNAAAQGDAKSADKAALLVSLRIVGAESGGLVRMIVDAETPLAGLLPLAHAPQRAL